MGPSWVASIVNAIGQSQYWDNTVILITWDDWGGWYDHVAPNIYNSYEYGFRVPLIVVSPFARQGYVSHVTHDFGSILHFIEEVYNLPRSDMQIPGLTISRIASTFIGTIGFKRLRPRTTLSFLSMTRPRRLTRTTINGRRED